jgi:oxygen-independent coproporphyrinogen-3 oxidase
MHFPFCVHLCNYCDFYKHKLEGSEQIQGFQQLLVDSWEKHQQLFDEHNAELVALESLYIGGGTPSLWSVAGANFFKDMVLRNWFQLTPECEFTFEVDPDTWTPAAIEAWEQAGVNRFSLGLQAFDNEVLKKLDRKHNVESVVETLDFFNKRNANFSLDFLIGVPVENRNVLEEIKRALDFNPAHFSIYILQARKNYPHYDELPEDDKIRDEYLAVVEFLAGNGYHQYEVSNFALEGRESVHNKKYWSYASVAALGPNATGLLVKSDVEALRYQWKSMSAGYQLEPLSGDSLRIEKAYLALRNQMGLSMDFFSNEELVLLLQLMGEWNEAGYLRLENPDKITLSPQGYLMLDSVIDDLFKEKVL